ncbi:uncharacterized protein METZ01_LOCUS483643 [marine metagenome]|uniref:Uncharacterized protein n=1 Tax=marine metagenome TaxID=408172 RepID=A0A383CFG4_9ZZZZ
MNIDNKNEERKEADLQSELKKTNKMLDAINSNIHHQTTRIDNLMLVVRDLAIILFVLILLTNWGSEILTFLGSFSD